MDAEQLKKIEAGFIFSHNKLNGKSGGFVSIDFPLLLIMI